MAVRGGAGLFDVLPLPYQFILLVTQAAPFFEYTSIKNLEPVHFLTVFCLRSQRTNCVQRIPIPTPSAIT